MRREAWGLIYGLLMMPLLLITNILCADLFNVDIYIIFFCNIVCLLFAIWYVLSKIGDNE